MISTRSLVGRNEATLDQLQSQHEGHEVRLEELKLKTLLTPEEEFEEKQLKKKKLRLKDQMELLRRVAS
ncbi:MAG: hypothetical protein DRJ61_08970 [Acidobacteria bacterium]|nr:MAG: hypothetical protein DRJ61_08970 [Acidobacteriota bacterium]